MVDVPVSAGNDPRAQIYVVDHLAPGAVIHRRIEVSNTTASSKHIVLYAAGASIVNGSFVGAAGHSSNDLSTWTSVRPEATNVPAGGHVPATVTIAVPSSAPEGERYGAVWAEARSVPIAGGGVTEVSRVGIRLYLSVGPGGCSCLQLHDRIAHCRAGADGRPMVVATVHNTGGRALDMSGTLQLSNGPAGLSAGPFPATLGTTLGINDTEPVTIALDKQLPAGPWDARITLRSGLLNRSAEATITFPASGAAPPVPTSTRPGWLYPVIAILVVLLLLATATLLVLRRRRRHADFSVPSQTSPRLHGADCLQPPRSYGLPCLCVGRSLEFVGELPTLPRSPRSKRNHGRMLLYGRDRLTRVPFNVRLARAGGFMRMRRVSLLIMLAVLVVPACSKSPATTTQDTSSADASATQGADGSTDSDAPRIEGTFKNKIKVVKAKGNFTESPVGLTYSGTMSFTPDCPTGACKTEVKVTGSSNYLAATHPNADGTYSWKAPGVPLQCGSKGNVVANYKPSKKTVTITPVVGSDGTVSSMSGTITNEWPSTNVKGCPATTVVSAIEGTKAA